MIKRVITFGHFLQFSFFTLSFTATLNDILSEYFAFVPLSFSFHLFSQLRAECDGER